LGTAYVAAMEGMLPRTEGVVPARQEIGIGVLPLELHVRGGEVVRVVMTQAKPTLGRRLRNVEPLANALGLRPRDITATGLVPQVASTGADSLQVAVRSLERVHELAPDPAALAKILGRIGPETGLYAFAFDAEGDADLHARGLFPLHGILEDPGTGSAAGACGAYLAANKRLPAKEWFVIEQGLEILHPGRIEVNVTAEHGRPTEVRVAGRVIPLMRGTLTLP